MAISPDLAFEVEALRVGLGDNVIGLFVGTFDPTVAGQEANVGSKFVRTTTGDWYKKTGALDTDWTLQTPSGGVISLTTIGGEPIPTFVDTSRANKILSSSEATVSFGRNRVRRNNWLGLNYNAADAQSSWIMPRDGTITRITGHCEDTAPAGGKGIRLYINGANQGVVGTFGAGTNQTFNSLLNIDFSAGDRLRMRGDAVVSEIQDTVTLIFYRWRG